MKTQKTFKEWFRQWDSGNFDFTLEMNQGSSPPGETMEDDHSWSHRPVSRIENLEVSVFAKVYPFAAAVLMAIMILFLFAAVLQLPAFGAADTPANNSEVVRRYVEEGLKETGVINIVSGVILDYRAFDTLGESHVLFTASTAVFILLLGNMREENENRIDKVTENDLILQKTARLLFPVILLFGIYIIFNGHLGPGGGFAGGAVIGGGLILGTLGFGAEKMAKLITMKRYRVIVSAALMFYSLSKCYSFFCGANGYETIFTNGVPGAVFSGGLILPLNIAVGIVVACTMYGFYSLFTRGKI